MAKIFNAGTQPLVVAERWGQGVVMPGEHLTVDDPEAFGDPWTTDPEAAKAARLRFTGEVPKPAKRAQEPKNSRKADDKSQAAAEADDSPAGAEGGTA